MTQEQLTQQADMKCFIKSEDANTRCFYMLILNCLHNEESDYFIMRAKQIIELP